MRHRNLNGLSRAAIALSLPLALAACGGGGDDSPNAPSSTQVLLADGDTMPDGFGIETIESANLANDRTVGFIASRPGPPIENAVYSRAPNGNITPVLTPGSPIPEGFNLSTMGNLVVSAAGDISFVLGSGLDQNAVFLYSGGRLNLVARPSPGDTPPGFRILGERRIANGGQIAFSYGVSPCQIDSSGESERITCTLKVATGDGDGIAEVSVPTNTENQRTTAITVIMHDGGNTVLGLPSGGTRSLVGRVVDGVYQSVLNRGQEIPGLGTVLSATPRAVNGAGAIVVDARFDTDGDGESDRDNVLLLANGQVSSVAQTGVPAGTKQILQVRGNAIDDRSRVVFTVTFGEPGQSTGNQSIRQWDNGTTREVSFEGQGIGQDDEGNDVQILEIDQLRVAANGDVVFRARIGFIEDGTPNTSEVRVLRWSDGIGETLLRTGSSIPQGNIVEINTVADINDSGDVLVIAAANRSANRVLLLLPRL